MIHEISFAIEINPNSRCSCLLVTRNINYEISLSIVNFRFNAVLRKYIHRATNKEEARNKKESKRKRREKTRARTMNVKREPTDEKKKTKTKGKRRKKI